MPTSPNAKKSVEISRQNYGRELIDDCKRFVWQENFNQILEKVYWAWIYNFEPVLTREISALN